jgi:hypothetical protein
LSKIFTIVVFEDAQSTKGPLDRPLVIDESLSRIWKSRYSLSSVCSTWNKFILTKGIFWSTFVLYPSSGYKLSRTMAPSLSIPRAGRSGLQFVGILDQGVTQEEIVDFGDHITGKTSQIQRINIRGHSYLVQFLLKVLLQLGVYPMLSEVSLHQINRSNSYTDMTFTPSHIIPHDSDLLWPAFTKLLSSLSVLRINGAAFSWHHMAFSSRLVELHLQDLKIGPDSVLAGLFNSAPGLCELRMISVVTAGDRGEGVHIISLPNLKLLLLEDLSFNTLEFLLGSIQSDSYQLTIHLTNNARQRYANNHIGLLPSLVDMEDLHSVLRLAPVHTLLLSCHQEWWLTGTGLGSLLKSIPTIRVLKTRA